MSDMDEGRCESSMMLEIEGRDSGRLCCSEPAGHNRVNPAFLAHRSVDDDGVLLAFWFDRSVS